MIEDKNILISNIAHNITYYRKQLNMTQLELAEKLNYSDKSVSKWERAEGTPDVFVLNELASFFGVTLDQFVNKRKTPPKKKRNIQVIAIFYALIVWVVMIAAFSLLTMFKVNYDNWKLFIYAIPMFSLVMLIFNIVYKKVCWIYLYMTISIWTLALSLTLIFAKIESYLVYIVAVPIYLSLIVFIYIKDHSKKIK